MSRDEDGFLHRWSRRKRRADHAEAQEPPVEDMQPAGPTTDEVATESETDEEILARLDLADPDTLMPGDDFTRYLRAPLPHHIRQRVLRRLWRSNPVLANLDGLNDYDGDFTGGSVPAGTLKSAFEVGRGFAGRAAEATGRGDRRQDTLADETLGKDAALEKTPPENVSDGDTTPQNAANEPSELRDERGDEETMQDNAEVRTSRRMVFRFDG